MIIAVDGPAASGKGTLASGLARHFGLPCLDTGLLYRAVGRAVEAYENDADFEQHAIAAAQTQIELTPEEATQIAGLEAEVQAALKTRETQRLKKAVGELDDLTEPLAARILEKLMG